MTMFPYLDPSVPQYVQGPIDPSRPIPGSEGPIPVVSHAFAPRGAEPFHSTVVASPLSSWCTPDNSEGKGRLTGLPPVLEGLAKTELRGYSVSSVPVPTVEPSAAANHAAQTIPVGPTLE